MGSPDKPFLLYHWSPIERRKRINRYGFLPNSHSVAGDWKPPYHCWSDSPSLAWTLSGMVHTEVKAWDLWMLWSNVPPGYEVIPFDDGMPKEYRIYTRVWKRDVWLVATRGVQ